MSVSRRAGSGDLLIEVGATHIRQRSTTNFPRNPEIGTDWFDTATGTLWYYTAASTGHIAKDGQPILGPPMWVRDEDMPF